MLKPRVISRWRADSRSITTGGADHGIGLESTEPNVARAWRRLFKEKAMPLANMKGMLEHAARRRHVSRKSLVRRLHRDAAEDRTSIDYELREQTGD